MEAIMTTQLKAPSDADIVRITRESEERRQREPHADSVSYDSSTRDLLVTLRGGSIIRTDARSLRGLGEATDEQLANVHVHDGRALFFDALDVQFSLIAFLSDALGLLTLSGNAQRAGSTRTAAKALASRANGAKGGRPRKTQQTVA